MIKKIKPTSKNSPAIKTGNARFNRPASEYAPPHTNTKKHITGQEVMDEGTYVHEKAGKDVSLSDPIKAGVSFGSSKEPKTSGIEMRGVGAAIKGRMSRGPMA